jgi:choline-sulfatase
MNKPNILFIMTDQQSRSMMSCSGNPYVKTPAMDSIAASGTRFTRAYCTNPVCVPSRFSLFSGRMPSEIKLQANGPVGVSEIPNIIKETGLGWTLKQGGYDAVFAGKQHLPKMNAEDLGFDVLTRDERDELARATADFVSQPHDKPWCLIASFINPHDICYMAIREHAKEDLQQRIMQNANVELQEIDAALAKVKDYPAETFFDRICPPLPPNFAPQQDEPEALEDLITQRSFRKNARDNWDAHKWQLHRWVYARLTERVDGQIQILLDALRAGPAQDNTVVIFTSDHGDHDASHGLEHKTAPYEEAAGIPLIISDPMSRKANLDETHLVSNGLDLYPTICDYAGLSISSHCKGRSLRPLIENKTWNPSRQAIPIETEIGNAIVSQNYKYLKCFSGERAEQLYDRKQDPYETRNAAEDPELLPILQEHRQLHTQWHPES